MSGRGMAERACPKGMSETHVRKRMAGADRPDPRNTNQWTPDRERRAGPQVAFSADEARGHPPRHVHHGRRPAERRVLRGHARPPAREEDGEPGRPHRLPPLLRRRARERRCGHHVLRVPGRAARPRGRRDGAPHRLPGRVRGGARLLGGARRGDARVRRRASPRPRRARARARGRRLGRPATDGVAPRDPRGAGDPRLRRRPRLCIGPHTERVPPAQPGLQARLGGAGRHSPRVLRLRRPAPGAWALGRWNCAPRRLGLAARGARGLEGTDHGRRRAADAGDRPLLLPLDLLPRAERRAVRDRDARRAGACRRAGVRRRRAPGFARRAAFAAAEVRAVARPARAAPHPVAQSASGTRVNVQERRAAGEPAGALVLFHGRGANEFDLLPLLDELDPERRLDGFCPRAPLSLPPGGAHWYVVPRVGYPDPESFAQGYAVATGFVDSLPHERVVVGGFSQGAVMSFAVGLGRGRPRPAAIVALSGFIPEVDGWELDAERPFPPIAIAHGTYDPIIPVEFAHRARETLDAAGAEVLYRESPMQHSIDPRVVAELRPWLLAAVAG